MLGFSLGDKDTCCKRQEAIVVVSAIVSTPFRVCAYAFSGRVCFSLVPRMTWREGGREGEREIEREGERGTAEGSAARAAVKSVNVCVCVCVCV